MGSFQLLARIDHVHFPDPLLWLIAGIFSISYVVAIACLVGESFRGLANMPVELYKEPEWSTYIPHIGGG